MNESRDPENFSSLELRGPLKSFSLGKSGNIEVHGDDLEKSIPLHIMTSLTADNRSDDYIISVKEALINNDKEELAPSVN